MFVFVCFVSRGTSESFVYVQVYRRGSAKPTVGNIYSGLRVHTRAVLAGNAQISCGVCFNIARAEGGAVGVVRLQHCIPTNEIDVL